MKKVLSFIICVSLAVSIIPQIAFYANALVIGECGAKGSHIAWEFDGNTETLTITGTGKMQDFASGGEGVPWAKYDEGQAGIKKIVISDGITHIGDYAFINCTNLICVQIGKDVKDIGKCAFYKCASLKDLVIPQGVHTIGRSAFASCLSLEIVLLPDSVITIGENAFSDCCKLVNVSIPNGVTTIGKNAFSYCDSLMSILIPSSVTTIDKTAFNQTRNVTIFAEKDSVAHEFAVMRKINFEILGGVGDTNDTSGSKTVSGRMKFSDVPQNAWYYSDLSAAYDAGIINGKTLTEFKPNDNMTCAEAIKLAACLHQRNRDGRVTIKSSGSPWHKPYVDYCLENEIISKYVEYDFNAPITRAEYMTIFAKALPDDKLLAINYVDDNDIPDIQFGHPTYASVYKLYRAGIVGGSDSAHNCNPDSNIKRSEVATILARMMFVEKRIRFSMQ